MILEDELSLANTLSAALEKSLGPECKTKICTTAEMALQMLQIHSFDLVIADWRLPGMSGLDFVTLVRQSLPDMPIIFMTAYSTEEARERVGTISGFFIEKPFEIPNLLFVVYQLLGISRTEPSETAFSDESIRVRRILILEDDESLSRLYQKVFRKNQFEICSASSFSEASDYLEHQVFDLFLCDVKLGDGFGVDLLQIWSQKLLENNTKTIVVSGDPWYRLVSEELGASFFFRKPVEMDSLIKLAQSLVP